MVTDGDFACHIPIIRGGCFGVANLGIAEPEKAA